MTSAKLNRLSRLTARRRRILILIGGLVVAGGVLILYASRAAAPASSIEADQGALRAPAALGQDATASSGQYVIFGQASPYNQIVLADRPVAFWAMSHSQGIEPDLSGHAANGTYRGGNLPLATLPNGDPAADFNGANRYLTIPSAPGMSIPTTHQLSWEGWIRPDVMQYPHASSSGYVDWAGKCQNYAPDCEWEARMYTSVNPQNRCNRLSAYVFNPSAGLGSGADWQPNCGLLQAGQWLHVVGEYQTLTTPAGCDPAYPGSINIWVNGVPWNQPVHSPTGCMSQYKIIPRSGNSPLNIGTMALDTWFSGAVGKVAIYNYLLSQQQINAHFSGMTGTQPSGSCSNSCTIPVPTP